MEGKDSSMKTTGTDLWLPESFRWQITKKRVAEVIEMISNAIRPMVNDLVVALKKTETPVVSAPEVPAVVPVTMSTKKGWQRKDVRSAFLAGLIVGMVIMKYGPGILSSTPTVIVNGNEKPVNVINTGVEPIKLVIIRNQTTDCEVLVLETDARGVVKRTHKDLKSVGDVAGVGVNPGMPKIILKVRVTDADGSVRYESSLHTFRFDSVNRDKKEKFVWSVGDNDQPDAVKKEI